MSLSGRLEKLSAGQMIPFGGDRFTSVGADLADAFRPGDRLVVVQESGELLHIPGEVANLVSDRVGSAVEGFAGLARTTSRQLDGFYEAFAARLSDDQVFAPIAAANAADVARAAAAGRSTTRLELSGRMRTDMVEALRMWRDLPDTRDSIVESVEHSTWSVEARRAPSGVVGFVFEGRPNVFADATGVLRSGNAVVFRIGGDALDTAKAMMEHALVPALSSSGLPRECVQLVDSRERAAGYALFGDRRLALAVARGSGPAVAQLGAVARQSGVPVSLHGTGGAWLVIDQTRSVEDIASVVECSLDRKVCNTANVICIPDHPEIAEAVMIGVARAAERRTASPRVHAVGPRAHALFRAGLDARVTAEHDDSVLATEWEWEDDPEVSVVVVDSTDDAVRLFNAHSPKFIVSIFSADTSVVERVYATAIAPFVGDGFTRWVDGQYALGRPELGLSNWEGGRLFARGGILSGDSVFTVRYFTHHDDPGQRR